MALVFMSVQGGDLQAYASASQPLAMSFGYGSSAPMNLDLSSLDFLRLHMIWAGAQTPMGYDPKALELTIYATTSNGLGLNPDGSALHTLLIDGGELDIPLSSFSTNSVTGMGVDWADVDGLLFVVSEVTRPRRQPAAGRLRPARLPGIRAVSVVKGRALPDVCDGNKPVQRRILYSMFRMGLAYSGTGPNSGAKPVKSARVVGDVLGKLPPARRQRRLRRAGAHGAELCRSATR
jgi:hypothetical protein